MNALTTGIKAAGMGKHCKDVIVDGVKLLYKSLTTSTINMARHGFSGDKVLFDSFQKAGGWGVWGTGLAVKSFIGLSLAASTMDSINMQRDMIAGRAHITTPRDLLNWSTGLGATGSLLAASSLLKLPGLASAKPWAMKGPLAFNLIAAGAFLTAATAVKYRINSMSNPSAGMLDANGPLFMNTDPNSSYAYMSSFLETGAAKRAWQDKMYGKPGEDVRGFLEKATHGIGNAIFGKQDSYLGVNQLA